MQVLVLYLLYPKKVDFTVAKIIVLDPRAYNPIELELSKLLLFYN